ncbi:unnamed protein product [Zymoseptoria tritici ST99CH_3D7]|uniref:Uncharacterized protein n=1 Tax=Zymoseptoria tritici (strain ST99CH_3D7) TaxID=1276538 RepID=A0A1X7RSM4_ZYMT9|nr:unnamed protein product [Zymoseptoria tritici ST99CH_3D7]
MIGTLTGLQWMIYDSFKISIRGPADDEGWESGGGEEVEHWRHMMGGRVCMVRASWEQQSWEQNMASSADSV